MVWLFLLQAYIIGFIFVSMRAKTVLKLADENWKSGNEYIKLPISCCTDDGANIDVCIFYGLMNYPPKKMDKEKYLNFSRIWHVVWFIFSPIWVDVLCLLIFIKNVIIKCLNIVPQLALVFEQDINIKRGKSVHQEENLELRSQIKDMQEQLNKILNK